jgi:hypothetical protein
MIGRGGSFGWLGVVIAALAASMLIGGAIFGSGAGAAQLEPAAAKTPTIQIVSFSATGSGTGFASPVATPCPPFDTCYSLSGNLHGQPTGNATFTANVNAATSPNQPNGSGGTCLPASGTMTITFASKSKSITLGFVGPFCDVGATPASGSFGPVTLSSSFYVTGGTGRKYSELDGNSGAGEGGAGMGTLVLSGDIDDGDVLVSLSGILDFAPPAK